MTRLKVLEELLGFSVEWPSQCMLTHQHRGPRRGDENFLWLGNRGGMLSNIIRDIVRSALLSTRISHQEMW